MKPSTLIRHAGLLVSALSTLVLSVPPLTRAIRIKEYDRALSLVKEGVGLYEQLPRPIGSTPLELAVLHNRLDLVRALMDAGGYPADAAEYALMRAAERGRTDIAAYLKGKGVRIGSTSKVYQAVLATNNPAVYRLLLEVPHPNFSLNTKDARIKFYQYGPFLPNAVILGSLDLVKDALEKGADIESTHNIDDYLKLSPLWLAAANRAELYDRLLEGLGEIIPWDVGICVFDRSIRCVVRGGWDRRTFEQYNSYYHAKVPFILYDSVGVAYRGRDVVQWGRMPDSEFIRDFALPLGLYSGLSPFRPALPRTSS